MLDLGIDPSRLAALVSAGLARPCRLTPLQVRCTYPVFRGETSEGQSLFVKIGTREEWERTSRLLGDIGACPFVPRLLVTRPLAYGTYAVFVTEWREASVVFPEDMSEAQADSFLAGSLAFSEALGAVKSFTPVADSPFSPERLYSTVADYVRCHPLAGLLLRGLVEIPEACRTYRGRALHVLHGDYHAKNFGFSGEAFARVIDFDQLTEGLPCGDVVNALVERYSCHHLSSAARTRLAVRTRRILARVPWPREELVIACNVLRLRFAARRLEKHPDSAWVALDVLRRDLKIRAFLKEIP